MSSNNDNLVKDSSIDRPNRLNWPQEVAFILVGSFVVPIGLRVLLNDELSWPHAITLGLIVTTIVILIRLQVALAQWRTDSTRGWIATDDFDEKLILMRQHHRSLKRSRRPVFAFHFKGQVAKLEFELKNAITANEIRITPTLDIRERLLRNMKPADVLRLVHFYRDNDEVFGPGAYWRGFQGQVKTAVEQRQVKGVERLFVYSNEAEKTDPFSTNIKEDHAKSGFAYVEVSERHYQEQKKDSDIPSDTHDFGIYGSVVVRWPGPRKDNTGTAVMIEDEDSATAYANVFARCWRLGSESLT